ncbi:MAG: riboflavin synthase [Flavobacteriales bacterium]|nr:riboflavin synthase [Flavobacteriales bacterium]
MFTGIIEQLGTVVNIQPKGTNIQLSIKAPFLSELKIDQSIAHHGVCLTVDGIYHDYYTVTAIEETLKRTNLGNLKTGDVINLERCMKLGDRLDGHIVQGHVDTIARVEKITENDGSWEFEFSYSNTQYVTVEKGSITVNGVSLTVVKSEPGYFSVAIIPYTFENTHFKYLQIGDFVNLEFDVIGKYVERLLLGYKKALI